MSVSLSNKSAPANSVDKYACDDVIRNKICLPYEHRKEIIKAAEWHPYPQTFPIDDIADL